MKPEKIDQFQEKLNDIYGKVEMLRQFIVENADMSEKQYIVAIRILNRFQDDLSEDLFLSL